MGIAVGEKLGRLVDGEMVTGPADQMPLVLQLGTTLALVLALGFFVTESAAQEWQAQWS